MSVSLGNEIKVTNLVCSTINGTPVGSLGGGGGGGASLDDSFPPTTSTTTAPTSRVAKLINDGLATQVTQAQTSAVAAANSAAQASASATQAAASATSANNFASLASTQATSSANSATQASTLASQASTSASQAATSASQASTSATNASNSAAAAATSATNASNSASAAATSATNASNSASAAATSATNASTAVANAQNVGTGATTVNVGTNGTTTTVGVNAATINLGSAGNPATLNINGVAYSAGGSFNAAAATSFGTSASGTVGIGTSTQVLNLNGSAVNINGTAYSAPASLTTSTNFGTSASTDVSVGNTSVNTTISHSSAGNVTISSASAAGAIATLSLKCNDTNSADGSDVTNFNSQNSGANTMSQLRTVQKAVSGGIADCGDVFVNVRDNGVLLGYGTATTASTVTTGATSMTLTITSYTAYPQSSSTGQYANSGLVSNNLIKIVPNTAISSNPSLNPKSSTNMYTITAASGTSTVTITIPTQTAPMPVMQETPFLVFLNSAGLSPAIEVNGATDTVNFAYDVNFNGNNVGGQGFVNAIKSATSFGSTASSTVTLGHANANVNITTGGLVGGTLTLTAPTMLSLTTPSIIVDQNCTFTSTGTLAFGGGVMTTAVSLGSANTPITIGGVQYPIILGGALSDETTVLTAVTNTVSTVHTITIRSPYAMRISNAKLPVFSVNTNPGTSAITLDILVNGTTIYSARPTIATNGTYTAGTLTTNPTPITEGQVIRAALYNCAATNAVTGLKVYIYNS